MKYTPLPDKMFLEHSSLRWMQLFANFRMHIPYARIVKIDTVAAEKASGAVRVDS
jgi:hypothetical protein